MVKLYVKSCPFCGNTKLFITPPSQFYEVQDQYGTAAIQIRCNDCKTDMWDHTTREKNYAKRVQTLVDKWNRRVNNDRV